MGAEKEKMNETKRLKKLLEDAGTDPDTIKALDTVIENTAWMKEKLDETREKIAGTSVAIPYDNGGGQQGIRENPLYKGYESLFKAYMTGMRVILDALPKKEAAKERKSIEKPKTVLELVRAKHSA